MKLTGMTDIWAEKQIKKKNEVNCVPWFSLQELVHNHPDVLKRVDMFALAIYGLIIFPKVLGHVEVAVVDFFEKLRQGINPVPTILAEIFRSLNACRKKGKGVSSDALSYLMFEFLATFGKWSAHLEKDWPKDITEQHWVSIFQNIRAEDITWRAP
ncbi:hypothetical protein Golax_022200 [Gossypium laxum]|uniref:DUF7745 domain-containing protein n=1 Tax=Gossypium laxum TaxID=34288 RepID=A0A7J9ANY4_9ROSI|nr:hypothetical protein [Gossypium laxum]